MKIFPVSLLIALLISFNTSAKFVKSCIAQYLTEDGWSKKYTVDVSFLSGSELNEATNSFNHDIYKVYAVIFWDNNETTIIKISTFTGGCGSIVKESCITNLVMDLKGTDQDGDTWKICARDFCY